MEGLLPMGPTPSSFTEDPDTFNIRMRNDTKKIYIYSISLASSVEHSFKCLLLPEEKYKAIVTYNPPILNKLVFNKKIMLRCGLWLTMIVLETVLEFCCQ